MLGSPARYCPLKGAPQLGFIEKGTCLVPQPKVACPWAVQLGSRVAPHVWRPSPMLPVSRWTEFEKLQPRRGVPANSCKHACGMRLMQRDGCNLNSAPTGGSSTRCQAHPARHASTARHWRSPTRLLTG